jgi:hypothetical protein
MQRSHLYVIKRKYADTYYTIRNECNIPSIIAFPYYKPAKAMLKTIVSIDRHKQPLVVEKLDEEFLIRTCKDSLQPLILFDTRVNLALEVSHTMVSTEDAKFYLENKYMYH